MAKKEPAIVLYYVPNSPGEGWVDIPKRNLTQRDVDRMDGAQLANATSPHPNGNPAIYQVSKPTGKRAEVVATVKEAAVTPVADKE